MTLLKTLLSISTFYSIYSTAYCQNLVLYGKVNKPDYCISDTATRKNLIGRKVKIYHEGGVYPTLNLTKTRKWPSEEMKQKGGESGWGTFRPQAGDTGIIVHIFRNRGNVNRYIYLLKVRDYYVPLGCNYLTNIDKLDSYKQAQQNWINDSIENMNYAAGCKFKIRNVNNNWSRAGSYSIDRQSEGFACELITKHIDTVMLCKYIFDNGSLPIEKAFVLWLDNGKGYIKSYYNNPTHQPSGNKVATFNVTELLINFFENGLDTLESQPKPDETISHSLGYSIQIYIPDYFYRERIADFIIRQDETHPKVKWWKMVSEKLAVLKSE